jgi:glycosyltransferase 2 family protein
VDTASDLLEPGRSALRYLRAHPRASKAVQVFLLAVVVAFCAWAVRSEWSKAGDRIKHASLPWLLVSLATVAVYYLVFILGWIRLLAAWGIRVGYRVALEAEMVSMLAKYIPGGVWTPAARTVALRKSAGVTDTSTVLASILVEAALSAVSGIVVFVLSLAWVHGVNAPLPLLIAFALCCSLLLHPKVFRPLSRRLLRPFGAAVEPLSFSLMLSLLLFYCVTWVIGGCGLYALLRAVGADPGLVTIPYLGGVSAVGAIVSVLAVFTPSGLGVREASMYGLLLAVVDEGPALSAALLNRLTITIVELALFGVGVVSWRAVRSGTPETAEDRP